MHYEQRLRLLARRLGCPQHVQLLFCPTCDEDAPLPMDLSTRVHALIDAIVARVGPERIRAIVLRVPPPPAYAACARCGGTSRRCGACQADYGRALFHAIGLTAAEQATWEALLAECRARERERR
jgi:hypothetical protein